MGRSARTVLFVFGFLAVVAVSMFAGVALFGPRLAAMIEQPCTEAKPRAPKPPNLFERAQKRFGVKIYSQWGEETLIRHFFDDQRDGLFVDIGAAACCSDSTTYYLESRLGWTGIAVDANASYRADYEKRRRGSRFFSYFISDASDKLADFLTAKFCDCNESRRSNTSGVTMKSNSSSMRCLNSLLPWTE